MTKIICRARDCVFWDDGLCASDEIVYDPDQGCLMYEPLETALDDAEDWDEDELFEDDDNSVSWESEFNRELIDDDDAW
ncbi:MAG: hypothetical protein ACE5H9_00870 [Anaerolineae bacterium]